MNDFLQTTVGKFIFRVKPDCSNTDAGLWLQPVGDAGPLRIGLTDFMQQSSGDIAFVELPKGREGRGRGRAGNHRDGQGRSRPGLTRRRADHSHERRPSRGARTDQREIVIEPKITILN
jgi:hypothetical protein